MWSRLEINYRWHKRGFKYLMLYLSLAGIITFSLFILEEAFQTTMFGTWPSQDAGRWDLVKKGVETMDGIVCIMNAVNYSVGWFQPLAFISYRAYAQSARSYIEGLKAKAIANAPALFVGESIDMEFVVKSIQNVEHGFLIRNGRFAILRDRRPEGNVIHVSGKLTLENNQLTIVE